MDMHTGARSAAGGESALISAVRAGDTALVKRLLLEDRDSETLDAAFGLAVRAYFGNIAQLLLQSGADSSQCRPAELLPLREAVDLGSPALVEALLDHRIRDRYPESELLESWDLAHRWRESGVEAELRRRTGSADAFVRTRAQDDEYYSVGELTLGGVSVRDGHGAILTSLEESLGIRTSFEELMARASDHDQDHAAWGNAAILLAHRRDRETWAAAAALRTHPDPSHRAFGAEVLRLTHLFDDSDKDEFAGPVLDIFTDWSTKEADPAVLTVVLNGLGEHADPRADAALLAHASHPDAGVRRTVAVGLGTWSESPAFSDDVRAALMVLMKDGEPAVRQGACVTVGQGKDREPVLTEAMAALLDDADRQVQVAAVQGLAFHNDARCVDAARRLGPPQPDFPAEEQCLEAAWRYEWRRDSR